MDFLKDGEKVEDLMIGGLKIIQSDKLYRFSSDSILLSKFAEYKKGDVVADFCAGSGIVGLHFYALNPSAERIDLYELQKPLCDMAERSVALNSLQGVIFCHNGRVQDIPAEKNGKYSLILCNPPYEKADGGIKNSSDSLSLCRKEIAVTAEEIISVAAKKLGYRGRLCMCHKTERLTDVLFLLRKYGLEPKRLQFIKRAGKENEKAYLFLVEGVKGAKSGLGLLKDGVN